MELSVVGDEERRALTLHTVKEKHEREEAFLCCFFNFLSFPSFYFFISNCVLKAEVDR